MTVQPAIGDPFFEMEDAYRWFRKRYAKVDVADLMSLSALDPPPGYAELQEEKLRRSGGETRHWEVPEWHHFRIYRDSGPPTLAVVLGMQPRLFMMAKGEADWMVPNTAGVLSSASELMSAVASITDPVTWRVWLYEHRQGRGWVCLDPGDETHEAVRRLRAEMVLEALR